MATKKKQQKSDLELGLEAMRALRTTVTKDKESATKFLIELGVLTSKGNLTKRYKSICTPTAQE